MARTMLPCAARFPTGRVDTAATRLTRCRFPGWSTKLVRVENTRTSAAPSAWRRTMTRTRSRRRETLRTTMSCQRCHGTERAFPNASVVGAVGELSGGRTPQRDQPCAFLGHGRRGQPPRGPREHAAQSRSVEQRPRLGKDGGRSRDGRSRGARPADRRVAADGIPVGPGVAVAIATPGATISGLTRPSYASPVEENGATDGAPWFARACGTPIDAAASRPVAIARTSFAATADGIETTGTAVSSSSGTPPAGSRAP